MSTIDRFLTIKEVDTNPLLCPVHTLIVPNGTLSQTATGVASLDVLSATGASALFLKLDQTTPQTVINGVPIFNVGLKSNGDVTIKAGQKLILDGA